MSTSMTQEEPEVVPKAVEALINSSGNSFHAKVARWFTEHGWHIVVSPYYMDQSQGKAREIDLVAEKLWNTRGHFGENAGHIAVRLFVECKYVATEAVFWFADKDTSAAKQLVFATHPFRKDNTFSLEHHYLSSNERVAKLFASNNAKASENEPFYKALNQALSATVSLRGRPHSLRRAGNNPRPIHATLEFPVVVCSSFDKMYSTDFDQHSSARGVSENFQLEVRYAYADKVGHQRDEYFLLDFVAFDQLPRFLEQIGKDAEAAAMLAGN